MANIPLKALKKEAKTQLADNYTRALAVLCVSLLFSALFLMVDQIFNSFLNTDANFLIFSESQADEGNLAVALLGAVGEAIINPSFLIAAIIAVFNFLITAPLKIGTSWWYYSLAANGNLQVGNVFAFYRSNSFYTSSIIFEIKLFLKKTVYALLSFSPAVIALIMAFERDGGEYTLKPDSEGETILLVSVALAAAGIVLYIFLSLNYFLSRYLFAIGECEKVNDAFDRSRVIMHGDKSTVVSMVVSLIGWYILCVFFIIPLGYVIPLHNACMARCARDILEKHKGYEASDQHKFVEL